MQREQEAEKATVGRDQLARAPTWLMDAVAQEEYQRITKELSSMEIAGNLDINNIAGYCNAYAMYRKATDMLAKSPVLRVKIGKDGKPLPIENPLIKVQCNYAEEMRKFARLCGLTIDSRLKMATMAIKAEAAELEDQFGDI